MAHAQYIMQHMEMYLYFFFVDFREERKDSTVKQNKTTTTGSTMYTYGGPPLGSSKSASASNWISNLETNLVAIDRQGQPIYYLISQRSLPELSIRTTYLLEKVFN